MCEEQYLLPQHSDKQHPLLCSPPQASSSILSYIIFATVYSPGATYVHKGQVQYKFYIAVMYLLFILTLLGRSAHMYMHKSK
jgi:hypothetical protein